MAWRGTSGCMRLTCWAQGCQASAPVAPCACLLLKPAVAAKGWLIFHEHLELGTPGPMCIPIRRTLPCKCIKQAHSHMRDTGLADVQAHV